MAREPDARPGGQGPLEREGAEGEDDVGEGVLRGEPADEVVARLVVGAVGVPVGSKEVGDDLVVGVLEEDGEENGGEEEDEIPGIDPLYKES